MSLVEKALQEIFTTLPKTILSKLLARKIKEAGVEVTPEVVDAFAEHLLSKKEGEFVLDNTIDDETKCIKLTITDEDIQDIQTAIEKSLDIMPEAVIKASEASSELLFESINERWEAEYTTQLSELDGFRERLELRWGKGLTYLRMLLTCCRDIGQEIHKRHNKSKSKRHMHRRWVLVRLQARACQVADEIICLMENGFADGAMARWRTLHELSVVAALIAEGNEDLAERYIRHDIVEVKRQADEYDATQVPLGFAPVSKRKRSTIERHYKAAIDKFEAPFAHPYGWAAQHLDLKKPSFKDVQIAAGRAGMSSYYKLASFNVHASARSLFFNLSSMRGQQILLAGRSNAGLVDPGERTAQTLLLVTSLYVGETSDLDHIAMLNAMLRIRDAVLPALRLADRSLVREERSKLKKTETKKAKRADKK